MWGLVLLAGGLLTWVFLYKSHRSLTPIPVQLTEKDNGIRISVKAGSPIVVSLLSNPSTGYGWYAATEVYPLGKPVVQKMSVGPSDLVGSPILERRTYKTTSGMVGAHRVRLEYKRPFDSSSVPPAKIFVFDTVVTP